MHRIVSCLILFALLIMAAGCSMKVPLDKVYGTYRTLYPFGTETITLNSDGNFVQQIVITAQAPVTTHGKWDYDSEGSRVNLDGFLMVVDGFGHLRSDWGMVKPGVASFDVEMHWFRIVMASAAAYPYVKQ
jgi:hypothetical protein